MSRSIRRIQDCYHTEAKGAGRSKIELQFHGDKNIFKVTMPFNYIPYLVADMKKAWQLEREHRVREINDLDRALP